MGKAHGENHDLKRKRGMFSGRPAYKTLKKRFCPARHATAGPHGPESERIKKVVMVSLPAERPSDSLIE